MSTRINDVDFEYFLTKQGQALVVSFLGAVDVSAVSKLEVLRAKISEYTDISLFILNFKDVPRVTVDAFGELVKIQKMIREKPEAKLFLAAIDPDIKTKLLKEGIVRTSELTDDLKQELLQFSLPNKK